MDFGPWIVWGKQERPAGLADTQHVDVVYINKKGSLLEEDTLRTAGSHLWGHGNTLAYRVERVRTTHVVYGMAGCNFGPLADTDTHKLTYVLDQDGEVVSCKMEKL